MNEAKEQKKLRKGTYKERIRRTRRGRE